MKAAAYVRYSSDNQREESIEAQSRAIKEYAERNNMTIVRIYADEAKSATTDDRPQFLQMIKDSGLGIFDVIIVHKLDRFARNRYDSAFYKRELRKNGIKLMSVLENLDDSPESIILESVLEGMAEYYSKNLAREVMKGMKETALQCKHNGGIPALGYDVKEDKTYTINEEEARIVQLIFELYAQGKSYNYIINTLNEKGYKTKRANPFGKNSIHDILVNEKYVGTYVFNRTISKVNGKRNHHHSKDESEIIRVENGIPAIVSKEVFEAVKMRMNKNKRGTGERKAKEVYLLSGKIFCGKCEGALVGNRRYAGRNKTLYLTYECSTRKRNKTCDAKGINKEYIENDVIEELKNRLFSPEAIETITDKLYKFTQNQNKEITGSIKQFEKELNSTQKEIDNLINAIAAGMFHPSMKDKMDQLESKKTELTIMLNEAKMQKQINSPTKEMITGYFMKDINIKEKSLEDQKQIIQAYVTRVIVYENNIDIELIVDIDGGGEGNRTPVRKRFHSSFYECSL